MRKVAAVGPREAVLAFGALGLEVVAVASAEEASKAVFRLAKAGTSVIFVTEAEYQAISETVSRYRAEPLPAILPIPGASGASGIGMQNVRANVEKAIGADILFKGEG